MNNLVFDIENNACNIAEVKKDVTQRIQQLNERISEAEKQLKLIELFEKLLDSLQSSFSKTGVSKTEIEDQIKSIDQTIKKIKADDSSDDQVPAKKQRKNAKLTERQVVEIKKKIIMQYPKVKVKELADEYKVSIHTIYGIKSNKLWSDILPQIPTENDILYDTIMDVAKVANIKLDLEQKDFDLHHLSKKYRVNIATLLAIKGRQIYRDIPAAIK